MAQASRKIGLLHHMGGGNLGDDGTLDAVVANIRKRWPDAVIFGFSMNPDDTLKRHGIPSYPIRQRTWSFGSTPVDSKITFKDKVKVMVGKYPPLVILLKAINTVAIKLPSALARELWFLIKSFRIIWSFDFLIITGGGQLVESSGGPWEFLGGPLQFPFTVFKWILLARLARVKCLVLNIGAGPLVRPLSKWFVRGSLSLADYASFRDAESRALVQRIGFRGKTHVVCDSAYSLETPVANGSPVGVRSKPIVGFAPMAYGDPRLSQKHDPAVYNDFIRQLATFCSWLLKNDYCVTLFCTDIGIDPPAIEDLERILRSDGSISKTGAIGSLCRVHQWSTEELLLNISSMDYVVVCRFHAVVFAHMMNVPVLAINHHPKVRAQMSDLGLSQYCVDIDKCDLDVLTGRFASLVKSRDEVKSRMAETLEVYKKKLSIQFDELFPGQPRLSVSELSRLAGHL